MPVFKHCFMSWDPAFKYVFLFSLTACPRVSPSSSQRGEFTLTNCFHFQKATIPWKLQFTYNSCSSVQSVQLLIAGVASLLIFLEDLNSSKLPLVLPAAHSVQQHFPCILNYGLHSKLRSGISCLVNIRLNVPKNP